MIKPILLLSVLILSGCSFLGIRGTGSKKPEQTIAYAPTGEVASLVSCKNIMRDCFIQASNICTSAGYRMFDTGTNSTMISSGSGAVVGNVAFTSSKTTNKNLYTVMVVCGSEQHETIEASLNTRK